MQNNKKNLNELAKSLHNSLNKDFAFFSQSQNELSFVAELSAQSYFQTYRGLFFAAIFFALVSQVASGLSSYTFYATLFQIKVAGVLLILTAVSVLVLVEIGKYFLFHRVFADMFSLSGKKMPWGLLLVGLALSGLSIYASVIGGGNLGIDHAKVNLAEEKFSTEIAQVRKEIAEIQHRNTWKGQTWLPTKEKTLLHQKEAELARLKEQKTTTLLSIDQENEKSKLTYQFGFGAFDLLFFLCLLFQYHYKKRCAVEYLANQTPVSKVASREETTPLPHPTTSQDLEHLQGKNGSAPLYVPNSEQKIGFMFNFENHIEKSNAKIAHQEAGNEHLEESAKIAPTIMIDRVTIEENRLREGTRICEYCGKVYEHNHKKHRYCSSSCRTRASEIRTGKKVKIAKKE